MGVFKQKDDSGSSKEDFKLHVPSKFKKEAFQKKSLFNKNPKGKEKRKEEEDYQFNEVIGLAPPKDINEEEKEGISEIELQTIEMSIPSDTINLHDLKQDYFANPFN